MLDEKDSKNNIVDQNTSVTETVYGKLEYMFKPVIKYYDAVLQKDSTNQKAVADLVVGDKTIGKDLPATFLLGLETKLKGIRDVVSSIPTLAPGLNWELDEQKGEGVFKAKDVEVFKTAKTFKAVVLYEAIDKHPAQVEKVEETINTGKYITTKWSSALSPADKSKLLNKVDNLIQATKVARQRANKQEVVKKEVGKNLVDYILS